MTEAKQPEALRLADALDGNARTNWTREEAAAELRRLHAENERLQQELIRESRCTAEQKLRADQMTRQHADQCAMRREDQERPRQCLHGISGPASPTSADEGGSR